MQGGAAQIAGSDETEAEVEQRSPGGLPTGSAADGGPRRLGLDPLSLAVFVVGLIVSLAVAVTAHAVYVHNEQRLLNLRVREAAAVLGGALPAIQTPLASAAELADATNGDVGRFKAFMAGSVGPGRTFVSASLWKVPQTAGVPLAVIGAVPALAADRSQAAAFLSGASRAAPLAVKDILGAAAPRLGYAFTAPSVGPGFAVYGESALPRSRIARVRGGTAFSELNYALYLGRSARPGALIEASGRLPLRGRRASARVPFGNTAFDLVMTPLGSLSGGFFRSLWWIFGGVGVILTLAATLVAERLSRGRRLAEQLAARLDRTSAENHRLYAEQRDIALTLQHALLPESLPDLEGLEAAARYVAGVSTLDIGGDWYDVISIDERRTVFVVGDVSGRGLRAASVMASLRHAIRAYAAETCSPPEILRKLSRLLRVERDGQIATVLCGLIDRGSGSVTVASAGHPPPLLLDAAGARYLTSDCGPPIGVHPHGRCEVVTTGIEVGATLLAYTDGLIERRGESLDAGLARLRGVARATTGPLDDRLGRIVSELAHEGRDDIAVLGIRRVS